jgi:large subunit ribosomal protein L17
MPHQVAGRHLGRNSAQRKALFRGLVTQVLQHERIETTQAKAKAVRGDVEKIITLAKRGDVHARRLVLKTVTDKKVVKKLFDKIGPRFADRNGGYTRIIKLGQRKSDSAPMAFIEWVDAGQAAEEKPAREKKAKRGEEVESQKKTAETAPPAAEEPKAEAPPKEEKPAAAPSAEESKPKKRRWFRRRSSEEK